MEEVDLLSTADAGPAAVRGGSLRVVGYVGGALLSAVGAALLFRHLGVDDTGRYGLVMAILAIAAGLTDLGMNAIGVRELSVRTGADRGRFVENLLGMRLVVSSVGVVLAVAFSLVAGYERVVVIGVLIGGVAMVLLGVQSTYSLSLQARLRLGWVTLADFVRQLIGLALVVALVLLGAELLPFFVIPFIGAIVVLALTIRSSAATSRWARRSTARTGRTMLRDILPFSVATAAATIYFRVSIVLVSLLSTAEQLGYFTASFRVIEAISGVPVLLVGAAFPILARAARDDHHRLGYAVSRVFDASLILGVWVAIELAVGAPFAMRVIGGAEFAPAADVLAIQGIGIGAVFVGAVWGNTLLSLGRQSDILRMYLVGLSIGTVLVAGLTIAEGARGAAIGTAAAELLLTALGAWFLWRAKPELLPPMGIVAKVALAAAIAAAPVLLGLSSAVLIVVSTVLYGVALVVLRAIPEEFAHALRSKRSSSVA